MSLKSVKHVSGKCWERIKYSPAGPGAHGVAGGPLRGDGSNRRPPPWREEAPPQPHLEIQGKRI